MMKISIAIGLIVAALVVAYLVLEKRPGYGAWYGIAKLSGARLDVGPVDFSTLQRHATGNDALVCPAGLCAGAVPEQQAKTYDMAPAQLLERLTKIALAEPDTTALDCGADCDHTARFLQISRIMRFPDTIDVAVFAVGTDRSTLAIYSRSLVGRRDFGVNRARLERWLKALESPAG
jgi:uncharacterized protein (DUF1499 family)